MENWLQRVFLGLALCVLPALAQQVEPDIPRQVVHENVLDSESWMLGLRGGVLSIEDFGSSAIASAQLAYHINEDFYINAEYAAAKAGTTSFEELSGAAPLLTDSERKWSYYGAHLGYVILPGEVFISSNYAMNSGLSVFVGGGNVKFAGDNVFALQLGSQFRLYTTDWLTLELTFSDYIYQTTVLAQNKNTHNLSLALGLAIYF